MPAAVAALPAIAIDVGEIAFRGLTLAGASATLAPAEGGQGRLRLSVSRVDRGATLVARDVALICEDFTLEAGALACAAARLTGTGPTGEPYDAVFVTRVSAGSGLGVETLQIATREPVPAAWIGPVFSRFDPSIDVTSGTIALSASAALRPPARTLAGSVDFDDLSFSGRNVAEAASGRVKFDATFGAGPAHAVVDTRLESGALYVEPGIRAGGIAPGFLIEADPERGPVRLAAVADLVPDTRTLAVREIEILHPGTLDCAGGARLRLPAATDAAPGLPALATRLSGARPETFTLACDAPDVAALYATYLQPVSYATALADLKLAGAAAFDLELATDRLVTGNFTFDGFHLADRAGRFGISDLSGDFAIQGGAEPRTSALTWASADILGLPIGAGEIAFVSASGAMATTRVADIPILSGTFHVDEFRIAEPGRENAKVTIAGRLSPVPLADLTEVFGWPPLGGVAAVRIPSLTYTRRAVTLDGVIDASVFDGRVAVRDLALDDLFGRVPRLTADVTAEALDLAQLTGALSFGNIEGHIDGELTGLVLESWRPVRFDAAIRSSPSDPTRRRISRRAVDDIGQLGAGAASPLSSGWLRFIPSYSYGEIGVGCRFRHGYCWLSGLEGAEHPGAFTILSPGGWLPPWIEIRGDGRLIAWETLRAGFERIGQGDVQVSLSE